MSLCVRLAVVVCVAAVACSSGPDDVFGGEARWEDTGDGEGVVVGGPWPVSDGRGYHRMAEGLRRTDAPEGEFVSLSVGWDTACGVRVDGELLCWGDGRIVPDGEFAKVWASDSGPCALDVEGSVVCWDFRLSAWYTNRFAEYKFAEDEFVDVAVRCGVRADGRMECWGPEDDVESVQLDVPEGEFVRVSGGCAQRADRSWVCRDAGRWAAPPAQAGQLTQIVGGGWRRCGLRVDALMVCWDPATGRLMDNPFEEAAAVVADASGVTETVSHRFADLGTGGWFSWCAIDVDARLNCAQWNGAQEECEERLSHLDFTDGICYNEGFWTGLLEGIPDGEFADVDIGRTHACALSVDRTIACWGKNREELPKIVLG